MVYQSFNELMQERRAWYKTVKQVLCPVLNETVVFNSKGFYHLRYDGQGRARSTKEQKYRIGLLPLAIPVIKCATKISHYETRYLKREGKYAEFWVLKENVGKQNT